MFLLQEQYSAYRTAARAKPFRDNLCSRGGVMSDTASLELSRELFELTGEYGDYVYQNTRTEEKPFIELKPFTYHSLVGKDGVIAPAFSAGYLLRKLPRELTHPETRKKTIIKLTSYENNGGGFMPLWYASYDKRGSQERYRRAGPTAEDALCALAIELHKAGILPISGRDL